jgi:hypothetical protein
MMMKMMTGHQCSTTMILDCQSHYPHNLPFLIIQLITKVTAIKLQLQIKMNKLKLKIKPSVGFIGRIDVNMEYQAMASLAHSANSTIPNHATDSLHMVLVLVDAGKG